MRHFIIISSIVFTACSVPGLQLGTTTPTSPAAAPSETSQAPASSSNASSPPDPDGAVYDFEKDRKSWQVVSDAKDLLEGIAKGSVSPGSSNDTAKSITDLADHCTRRVQYDKARGIPANHAYEVDSFNLGVTVGDADAKICRPLAAKAAGWDEAVAKLDADREQQEREKRQREDAAYAASKARAEAPYRRVGIDGDKLVIVAGGTAYTAGMIPATPERAAHASVLFTLGAVTTGERLLVRYEFRGNKKVGETEQTFWTNPGPEFYR